MSKKKRIILMVGKSGAGKSWVTKMFEWDEVVSSTTRSPRSKEIPGVDKNFVSRAQGEKAQFAKDTVAWTEYHGNIYFAKDKDLYSKDVYVIDPTGVRYFLAREGNAEKYQTVIVYVTANPFVRFIRMYRRDSKGSRLKRVSRILSRMWHDVWDFRDVEYDIKVRN